MERNIYASSKNQSWETPIWLFDALNLIYKFTLDPCASRNNSKCKRYFNKKENGLSKSWAGERVFMNPPYGKELPKWIKKAYGESNKALIVCLIPARTETKYWHEYIMKAKQIYFLKGRLNFSGSTTNAPFPSAVVIFHPDLVKPYAK